MASEAASDQSATATPVAAEHALGDAEAARSSAARAWARTARAAARTHAPVAPALALAALLDTVALAQNGFANTFYAAGVESMLRSWHNFFFVSFDPGGLITIDKPPLALWAQAASAKLLGFTPLALLLPEALAGVATVGALYFALVRPYGRRAALAGALALASFPAFVAVARDNGPDPLMVLLMTLACVAALRAIRTGGWRSLLASAALIGLAFETKTLAAYLVVPPIACAYLVCAPGRVRERASKLLVAGALMAALSLAWLVAVDLIPASARPYVGGSADNSELGLAFAYNGLGRLGGQEGAPGAIRFRPGATVAGDPRSAAASATAPAPDYHALGGGAPTEIRSEAGPRGPLRLFDADLGGQGAWLLPLALLGLIGEASVLLARARRGALTRGDPRVAALLVLGGWFGVEASVLSFAGGIVHPYYVSALGPGAAALVGIAFALSSARARVRSTRALPLAVAATMAVQIVLLARDGFPAWLTALSLVASALALVVVLAAALPAQRLARARAAIAPLPRLARARATRALGCVRRTPSAHAPLGELGLRRAIAWYGALGGRVPAAAVALTLLMVAPAAYSATTWLAPVQGTFPAAGPRAAAGVGGVGLEAEDRYVLPALARYVGSHEPGARFSVLTVASVTAAPLILMGTPAAALAGYGGTDQALGARGLARLVRSGQARYVLLGGPYSERGGNGATRAVLRACPQVPAAAWGGPPLSPYSLVLFDCAGRADALARVR